MNIQKDLTSFLKSAARPLVVILGPTAAGKTKFSIDLAKKIGQPRGDFSSNSNCGRKNHHAAGLPKGEIISTDSRQIYKYMPISNDRISEEEKHGVPHHMIEITPPDKTITLAEYKEMTLRIIEEIYKRGHIPMLVGGTGLYISAIIENYNVPHVGPDEKLREKLGKQAKEKGSQSIHKKLEKLDPEAAARIHPNNIRYVIRAIEVAKAGKSPAETSKNQPFDTFIIGINRPRREIYSRIGQRIDEQIAMGLVGEAKNLLKKGYDTRLPSMSSLGIKEMIPYIKGKMPLSECVEILKKNTRNYAKRQMTWFRRYDNVRWLDAQNLEIQN